MNLEDERRLKFDRRLRSRRDWVSDEEVQSYEASLPDAAEKVAKDEDDETSAAKPESGAQ